MTRSKLFIILILGLILFISLTLYLSKNFISNIFWERETIVISPSVTEESQGVIAQAVFALRLIRRGEEIMPRSIRLQRCPACEFTPDTIFNPAEVYGKIAKIEIIPGHVLERSMFVEDGEQLDRGCLPALDNIAVCFRGNEQLIYVIDRETTQELWRIKSEAVLFPTLTVSNDTVYFWQNDAQLQAIEVKTGQEKWRFRSDEVNNISELTKPTVVDSLVLFWNAGNQTIYALEAGTGQERWRFESQRMATDPALVADKTISFISLDGYRYALNIDTGQELWKEGP